MNFGLSFLRTAVLILGLMLGMTFGLHAAKAATLNLSPGESVIIQPNVTTTVICGAGTPVASCGAAIKSLESRFAVCEKTYSSSTCFQNEWPAFKTRSPECVTEAFDTCYRLCSKTYPGSTCYQNCR